MKTKILPIAETRNFHRATYWALKSVYPDSMCESKIWIEKSFLDDFVNRARVVWGDFRVELFRYRIIQRIAVIDVSPISCLVEWIQI